MKTYACPKVMEVAFYTGIRYSDGLGDLGMNKQMMKQFIPQLKKRYGECINFTIIFNKEPEDSVALGTQSKLTELGEYGQSAQFYRDLLPQSYEKLFEKHGEQLSDQLAVVYEKFQGIDVKVVTDQSLIEYRSELKKLFKKVSLQSTLANSIDQLPANLKDLKQAFGFLIEDGFDLQLIFSEINYLKQDFEKYLISDDLKGLGRIIRVTEHAEGSGVKNYGILERKIDGGLNGFYTESSLMKLQDAKDATFRHDELIKELNLQQTHVSAAGNSLGFDMKLVAGADNLGYQFFDNVSNLLSFAQLQSAITGDLPNDYSIFKASRYAFERSADDERYLSEMFIDYLKINKELALQTGQSPLLMQNLFDSKDALIAALGERASELLKDWPGEFKLAQLPENLPEDVFQNLNYYAKVVFDGGEVSPLEGLARGKVYTRLVRYHHINPTKAFSQKLLETYQGKYKSELTMFLSYQLDNRYSAGSVDAAKYVEIIQNKNIMQDLKNHLARFQSGDLVQYNLLHKIAKLNETVLDQIQADPSVSVEEKILIKDFNSRPRGLQAIFPEYQETPLVYKTPVGLFENRLLINCADADIAIWFADILK